MVNKYIKLIKYKDKVKTLVILSKIIEYYNKK